MTAKQPTPQASRSARTAAHPGPAKPRIVGLDLARCRADRDAGGPPLLHVRPPRCPLGRHQGGRAGEPRRRAIRCLRHRSQCARKHRSRSPARDVAVCARSGAPSGQFSQRARGARWRRPVDASDIENHRGRSHARAQQRITGHAARRADRQVARHPSIERARTRAARRAPGCVRRKRPTSWCATSSRRASGASTGSSVTALPPTPSAEPGLPTGAGSTGSPCTTRRPRRPRRPAHPGRPPPTLDRSGRRRRRHPTTCSPSSPTV